MPKSLAHYIEDRPQLVDQLFTILSESDVKGMLPDILKVRILLELEPTSSINLFLSVWCECFCRD